MRMVSWVLAALAGLFFAARTTLMKMTVIEMAPAQALWLQNLFSLAFWLPLIPVAQLRWPRNTLLSHLLRAFSEGSVLFMVYLIVRTLPTVHGTTMALWAPIFLPVAFWIWQRQRFTPMLWLSLSIGWLGVVLMFLPSVSGSFHLKMLGIAAGIFGAITYLSSRSLRNQEHPFTILFWAHLLPAVAFFPLAIWQWTPPSTARWWMLVAIGLFSLAMELLLIKGTRSGQPIPPLIYLAVLFSAIADWMFWRYIPSILFFIALVLVIAGCCIALILYTKKTSSA